MIRKALSLFFAICAFLLAFGALVASISDDFGAASVLLIGVVAALVLSIKMSPRKKTA